MERDLSRLRRERELDPESESREQAYQRAKQRTLGKRELLDDLTVLFEPDFDSRLVTVQGLALSDPASDIPLQDIVACARPGEQPPKRRQEKASASFDRTLDTVLKGAGEVELKLSSKGFVGKTVSLKIEQARISEIKLSRGVLEELGIDSEDQIHEKWGRIDHYERSLLRTKFVPPGEGTLVCWNHDRGQLDSVLLSQDVVVKVPVFWAQDLIRWSFDWDPEEASFEDPPENGYGTAALRGRRLKALFRAFGLLDLGLNSVSALFRGGEAVAQYWEGRHVELWSMLEEEGFADSSGLSPLDEFGRREVRFMWNRLVEFQRQLNRTCEFGAGASAGGFYFVVHNHTRNISRSLIPERNRINKILSLLIDPQQRAFTWGELVRDCDFPDEDLDAREDVMCW